MAADRLLVGQRAELQFDRALEILEPRRLARRVVEKQDRRARARIGQELEPRAVMLPENPCHGSFQRRCDLVPHGDTASGLGPGHSLVAWLRLVPASGRFRKSGESDRSMSSENRSMTPK